MTAVCLIMACFGADVYTDFFARGNAAYAEGAMDDAVVAYEQLVGSGVTNPEVFYNLGNSRYHLDDFGRAILNYERALAFDPDFMPAQRTLALVVGKTRNHLDRPDRFRLAGMGDSWIPGVPQRVFRMILAGFWCGLWAILIVGLRRVRPLGPPVAAALGIMLVLCAILLAFPAPQSGAAVVTANEAAMRYGPDRRDTLRFELAAGDRVLVDAVLGDWARVETAAGVRGWVERDALTGTGPPFVNAKP